MKLTNALKGISGEYEINRLVGAFGSIAYVVSAIAFEGWDVMQKGRAFDVTAFCIAFPTGLGVAVGAIAGAVALKDRNVATAKVVESTGSLPATPPMPPAGPATTDATA
ncbi:hypothetical protein [Sphingomonas beigongshangi]|uniref:hypothetical protein n=1 Tax=Sphingomonas beigongshangi TaxID=2782540 RepID=UPI00193B6613|nr:hypothetical protein [Sphingomonas beigongshangi]